MKRDWDLCLRILEDAEKCDEMSRFPPYSIEGYSEASVAYHVRMLMEAGLIRAEDFSYEGHPMFVPQYLTWQGHEFLEPATRPGAWAQAMKVGRSAGFEIIKALVLEYTKKQVGL